MESKNKIRIFQQCYAQCCNLQNIKPISSVLVSGNGKHLDFCVDRIKYMEWAPILNALCCDISLHSIAIRLRQQCTTGLDPARSLHVGKAQDGIANIFPEQFFQFVAIVRTLLRQRAPSGAHWLVPFFGAIAYSGCFCILRVLEQIDCERLAKTVTKRPVILTNFMLRNLVDAVAECLLNTSMLDTLLLEGLPIKIPYLNPLVEAIIGNHSLQHLYLPRCGVGDAGCSAICRALRNLPNIVTLDLSACELTATSAETIAELVNHQKIHRYSENWKDTLRYRIPELDAMAGLRRISLCGNPGIGDRGAAVLFDVLADDLWIKAIDLQQCDLGPKSVEGAFNLLRVNTTLVILDMRSNPDISHDSLVRVRATLKDENRTHPSNNLYSWMSSSAISSGDSKTMRLTNRQPLQPRDRSANGHVKTINGKVNGVKKEKDYLKVLEMQLEEEKIHRKQLEELNDQLVLQVKQMKQQQFRRWNDNVSVDGLCSPNPNMGNTSESSSSVGSVSIDYKTLVHIQKAFKEIYDFIRDNQCNGQCNMQAESPEQAVIRAEVKESKKTRAKFVAKKARSMHLAHAPNDSINKYTKSASFLPNKETVGRRQPEHQMVPAMMEKHIGDSCNVTQVEAPCYNDEIIGKSKGFRPPSPVEEVPSSKSCSSLSESSDVMMIQNDYDDRTQSDGINPREAFYSSSEEECS